MCQAFPISRSPPEQDRSAGLHRSCRKHPSCCFLLLVAPGAPCQQPSPAFSAPSVSCDPTPVIKDLSTSRSHPQGPGGPVSGAALPHASSLRHALGEALPQEPSSPVLGAGSPPWPAAPALTSWQNCSFPLSRVRNRGSSALLCFSLLPGPSGQLSSTH